MNPQKFIWFIIREFTMKNTKFIWFITRTKLQTLGFIWFIIVKYQ